MLVMDVQVSIPHPNGLRDGKGRPVWMPQKNLGFQVSASYPTACKELAKTRFTEAYRQFEAVSIRFLGRDGLLLLASPISAEMKQAVAVEAGQLRKNPPASTGRPRNITSK